jgi:pyrimidine-nucleoside phosphorylase
MRNPVELIRAKRDGLPLGRDELEEFVAAYVDGNVPEYQMAAFLMAVYFQGMTPDETLAFTEVMLRSGEIVDLSAIPGRKVDKHSTGGVGDKVSLILAPMVAACGVPVPMISGRGLGHTGGTLDKLESIPGFRTDLSIDEFRSVLGETGLVLAGQTAALAPADRKMYALRDVTGTIESLPLIAGSIMSKKLAAGVDALVLDVKAGAGAFMPTAERAAGLARELVGIGTRYGKETVAFVTAMDQPLGFAVGNWVEVLESVECLRGRNIPDLMEVTTVLGGAMVHLARKAASIEEGMRLCRFALWSGRAYEKFCEVVRRQGGDDRVVREPDRYPPPRFVRDVPAPKGGFVQAFDTKRIGVTAVELGAGRRKIDDIVDPVAGILVRKKLGERVDREEPLARVQGSDRERVERAARDYAECLTLGDDAVSAGPRVICLVDGDGARPWTTPDIH